jgi:hypothetical protein
MNKLAQTFVKTVADGLKNEADRIKARKHVLEHLASGGTAKTLLQDPWDAPYAERLRAAIRELRDELCDT